MSVMHARCYTESYTNNSCRPDSDYMLCADRWKNMKEDLTKKMWGIFDETGVFLALCRHGFCLVIADMSRAGNCEWDFISISRIRF